MFNLTVFEFQGKTLRVIIIDNNFWFVAKDVCQLLEHSDVSMACQRLKDYEKDTSSVCTPGGQQDVLIISESGLYRLVLTSRKPQAETFQDWVCQEVIPSIRKTGKYESQPPQPQSIAQMFLTVAQGLVEAEKEREQLKVEQNRQRLELQEAKEAIAFLHQSRQEALNQLNEVERSSLVADPKSTRAKLVELVRKYSAGNNIGFGVAFKKIYTEFKYRYNIDILARAKNQNKSGLIIAEQIPIDKTGGVKAIEVLFAIASEVLV